MKKSITISLCIVLIFSNLVSAKRVSPETGGLYFIENKGQISDQHSNPRSDIQFVLKAKGITVFIGKGQLHYQFSKSEPGCQKGGIGNFCTLTGTKEITGTAKQPVLPQEFATYRMDVALAGADINANVTVEDMQPYYENYYLPGCPENGIQAHTYKKITYKNVYPSIDWVICIKGDHLEHEFVVGPDGDASVIRLKYEGQTSLKINNDGSITATTPMGIIREHAPLCYTAGGLLTPSSFSLKDNILSYNVKGTGGLLIDPVLEWGTYYGTDSNTTNFYSVVCDAAANVYACGLTWSAAAIATTGGFQNVYGGNCDGFVVKFDSSGHRIWGSYYGGTGGDWATGVACDPQGNVYVTGVTQGSLTGIATPGSQQPVYGGGLEDGFLVKFTPGGIRKWGTYIGGTGAEIPASVACDILGHVYVGGFTSSGNNIATPGSYMPVSAGGYENFIIQYDTAGVRQWGTYYGGSSDEFGGAVCTDGINVYITGFTSSTNDMTTPGCFQPTLNGSTDAYVAKFNTLGNRLWGSYYGGNGGETAGAITCDASGSIYLLGTTSSDAGMVSPGCFQPARGGRA